jgi:hypothetical protein
MIPKTWSRTIVPALLLLAPVFGWAQVSVNISVNVPPPELPVYEQPPIPEDGYIWTPGYWAWGDDIQDYYWVPGTWVPAPQPDVLWTPGYWGFVGGAFLWNAGYWGPHVGFYGGVNYGYGYGGSGYEGGYWQGGHLYYNRAVNNISTVNVTNVYNKTVINNVTVNHVSYNGGSGGVRAEPSSAELAAAHERHIAPTSVQRQQQTTARSNPVLRASANGGHPPIAATARPGVFSGPGVVAAKRASENEAHPAPHPAPHPATAPRPVAQPPRAVTETRPQSESRPAESRPVAQPPRPVTEARPVTEPRPTEPRPGTEARPVTEARPPAPPPHASAPPPPKPAPRPAEHPPEHPDDREHH